MILLVILRSVNDVVIFKNYLILCQGLLSPNYEDTKLWIDWAFHEYGLPTAIRTDNGIPFSSISLAGLSRLSVHWIKLGIRPERIDKDIPSRMDVMSECIRH